MRQLKLEFDQRGPWVTGFSFGKEWFGGDYKAEEDKRLAAFFKQFSNPGRVLELGCLEGGHTVPIARVATEVVAVDSRRANLDRAQWVCELYGAKNIRFVEADLETFELEQLAGNEGFDVVFNVGLLYHLLRPAVLLQRIAAITKEMFLWTHIAADYARQVEHDGYRSICYEEFGVADPLSGMSPRSFWPTYEELRRMLGDAGFQELELINTEYNHPHGPAVLMICRTKRKSTSRIGFMERLLGFSRSSAPS